MQTAVRRDIEQELAPSAGKRTGWVRLALVAGSVAVGAIGYRELVYGSGPWWGWASLLATGWAYLILAFAEHRSVEEPRWWLMLRRGMVVPLLIAVAAAIRLLPQHGRELQAGTAVAVSLLAFVVMRWRPFTEVEATCLAGRSEGRTSGARGEMAVRAALAVAALAAGAGAAYVNRTEHLGAFILWGASLGLFALAFWPRRGTGLDPDSPWRGEAGPELSRAAEMVGLALVLLVAIGLRTVLLDQIPPWIDPDEGRQGRFAERIWQNGFPDAFGLGWNVFPNLSYMVEYVWVQLLGTSNANLRLSAALVGSASILPLFFWSRRWWGNAVALLAAFLLAINREHILWSRLALNNIQQVLVAGLMLATFARALQRRRAVDWVWFGYATGLAFHTYHAAKLFPALLAVAALLFAAGMRGFLRRHAAGAAVAALACVLCIGPLLVTMYRGWDHFYASTSNRTDLHQLTAAYARDDVAAVRDYSSRHVIGCLRAFVDIPSVRDAILDPFTAVPFLLGIGWMAWHWRDARHLVALVWLAGILVIGGMITDYPPWKARLLGFLPVVALVPAVVAGRWRGLLFRCVGRRADVVVLPVLGVWLSLAFHYNWYTELVLRGQERGNPMGEICRTIERAPLPATLYLAGGGVMEELRVAANDCMIAPHPDRVLVNLGEDPFLVPVAPASRGNALLLLTSRQRELLPLVRHHYPEARYDAAYDRYGTAVLHVFTMWEHAVERQRGLRAVFRDGERVWESSHGTHEWVPPPEARFPLEASWRGLLWITAPGEHVFRPSGAELRIDSRAIVPEDPVKLSAGWHQIDLTARFEGSGQRAELQWKPPGVDQWERIPRALLHVHPEAHGLLGRYFRRDLSIENPDPIGEIEPDYTRIDPVLSFDWYSELDDPPAGPFAARPSVMEWSGTADLPEGSDHRLRLESTDEALVFVDGELVLRTGGSQRSAEAQLVEKSGTVRVLVRSRRSAESDWRFYLLRLLWSDGAGSWTAFVPYRPPQTQPGGGP